MDHEQPMCRRRSFVRLLEAASIPSVAGCVGNDSEQHGTGDTSVENDWQTATLEDAHSGETFRIEAFEGPTIVHTFASNCLTCATQQDEFLGLREQREDIVIVELSVDPNDTAADIAAYAERGGQRWYVGVAPASVTASLIEEFGQTVSVSAQSPIVIRCPSGQTRTVSKVAEPDELAGAIEESC